MALTSAGLEVESLEEITAAIKARLWGIFGTTLALTDASLFGQIVGVFSERIALCNELLEAIYNSQDPDSATGTALEALAALTGTTKLPASPSAASLTLTGTNATVVALGSRAANASAVEFATDAAATLVSLTAWAGTTAYVVGNRRSNSGRSYVCIIAGTSAGSGGPTTTSADITDGTVHWLYIGDGAAAADVTATATVDGPNQSIAGTITEIVTPVSGWSGVRNLLDAELGRDIESDEDLRTRRELELSSAGTSPPDAIRAALLEIDDVTTAIVFYNNTDFTDADGVPPHAVEALVQGGDDDDILECLHRNVAAGIYPHGTTSGIVTDDAGNDHTYRFTRPTLVPIYVDVVLLKDPAFYPLDGDAQVEDAIVAYGDSLPVGRNAVASAIGAQAFRVSGVLDVTTTEIDDAPAPASSATVVIGSRELATYDTSRITVTSSNGTP